MNITRNTKLLTGLLCVLAVHGCRKESPPPKIKPTVVLISIDTLRADYLKLYSSKGVSTPNLEQIAREGVIFKNVIAQVPYTLPSHSTMLTGIYPAAHRVRDNVRDALPASIPTLAEVFKKNGYQTSGFAGSMVLSHQTGLSRGFDYYDDFFSRSDVHAEDLGGIERRAGEVLQSFEYWLDHRQSSAPFFAFIHFYDPHSPYNPPPGYAASRKREDLYAGEIKYVDFVLGKLFSLLKNKNIWNNAAVLITSDHGEMLNEHSEVGHGFFLYRPALAVPFLLRGPGLPSGAEVNDVVELADLAPTLLNLTGLTPPSSMQGESLVPLLNGAHKKKNRAAFAESYFASLQFGVSPIKMVQEGSLKYIEAPRPELYDLSSDPGEVTNLVADRKSDVEKLKTRLSQFEKAQSRNYTKEQRSIAAEEAEQFAAIGYLGGQIPESRWDLAKDPKDYIDEWTSSLEATYLVEQREYRKALELIRGIESASVMMSASLLLLQSKCYAGLSDIANAEKVLKPLADTSEALTTLAELYENTGRVSQAEQYYARALEKQFSFFTLFNYVLLLRDSGQKEKAIRLLEKVRNSKENTDRAQPFFAEMYIALENWQAAETILVQLMKNRPWEAKWYRDLATVLQSQGKFQNALDLLSANNPRFLDDPEYQLRLGILLNRTGQKPKEMVLFQEFIRNWPEDSRGYFYLGKAMLDSNQDPAVVAGLAQKGLAQKPDSNMEVFGYFILGNAFERMGKIREAQRAFATAERLENSPK
ncbi:sulfatase-like hydrolase/transferase [bacterium]|nr:sulfatase-like hydrolase/transferase [bacterium]